jgi:ribosomal protein S8
MRRTHPPICSLLLTLHLLSSLIPTLSTVFFLLFSGYIGEFEIVDDHRSGKIVVNLTGRLNKCGVISPRFDVPINDIEKWTNNLLPSRQFGYVLTVLSI